VIPAWADWWCCLSTKWQLMFEWMGTFSPPVGPYYLKDFYDDQFAFFIGPTSSWLYDWFNTSFEVTFGTIEIEPGIEVEVAIWNPLFYASFQLWKLNPAHGCPEPCPYTSGYFALPPV